MVATDWDLISSYAGLQALAVTAIYAGAFSSLPKPPRKPSDASNKSLVADEDEDEEDIPDRLSSEDAWLFPVFGSVALFGLYTIVKYFGKEWINYLLGWYFSIAGVGSVWKSLIAFTKFTVGNDRWTKFDKTKLLILKGPRELVALSLRTPSILLFPIGIVPSMLYTFSTASRKSALLTDILSMSFSYNALSMLKIDSFKTGCILLSGLFLYDIWWVFGTDVMVSVATNLDVPIKLLWPKSVSFSTDQGFTMLGLGDIVIPGVFVALALRYDHHRYTKSSPQGSFTKPYFYAAIIAYILGLATTMTVMHVFKAAQPALLYLSPACILSFLLTALVRGEFTEAWSWSDEPEKKPEVEERYLGDAKPTETGNSSTAAPSDGVAETENVEEKTDAEPEGSETEKQPKKKGKKKTVA